MPAVVRLGAWLFAVSHILFYVLTPRLSLSVKAVKVDDPDVVVSSSFGAGAAS